MYVNISPIGLVKIVAEYPQLAANIVSTAAELMGTLDDDLLDTIDKEIVVLADEHDGINDEVLEAFIECCYAVGHEL